MNLPQKIEELLPAHEDPPCDGTDEEKIRYDERRRIAEQVFEAIEGYRSVNFVNESTLQTARGVVEVTSGIGSQEARVLFRVIHEARDLRKWLGLK